MSLIGYHYFKPALVKDLKDLVAFTETKPNSLNSNVSASTKDLSTQDESYVLIDPQSTIILKSSKADLQRAPASTTKLLTGLIAVKTLSNEEFKMLPYGDKISNVLQRVKLL